MFERFTDRARRVMVLAQEEARTLNHHYIGTEHILLALLREREGIAAKVLESVDIGSGPARQQVEIIAGQGHQAPSGHIPFTPQAKTVLEFTQREAAQLDDADIDTAHILLGLIREGEGAGAQVVVNLGVDLDRLRLRTLQMLSGGVPDPHGSHADQSKSIVARLDRIESTLSDIVARLANIERRLIRNE